MSMLCERPDVDVGGLVCGHPLPCPNHTVIIHADKTPPTIEIPATAVPYIRPEARKELKIIAQIFHG